VEGAQVVSNAVFKVMSLGATVAATKIANTVVSKGWRAVTGKPVPVKDSYEKDETRDIVVFTALSAALVATMRVLAERGAVNYYRNSTGHLPKALEEPPLSRREKKAHRKIEKAKKKTKQVAS
jgi:hypothetical protein